MRYTLILFALALSAFAQTVQVRVNQDIYGSLNAGPAAFTRPFRAVSVAPSGACTAFDWAQLTTNGALYRCNSSLAWEVFTTGGGSFENPLTFSTPLARSVNTISIPVATSVVNGYLASADWTIFNGKADSAHTHPAADVTSGTFADARVASSNVTQHQAALAIAWGQLTGVPSTFAPSAHNHPTSEITSGTFADARIAGSNVTQHQALLSIGWSQLTGLPSSFTPSAHASSHAPGSADALPWTTVHGSGTLAGRPSAAATNAGYLYFATDSVGGQVFRSDGSTWTALTLGLTDSRLTDTRTPTDNTVSTAKIVNSAVTLGKIENIAGSTILCNTNPTSGAAPQACTAAQTKTLLTYLFSDLGGTATDAQVPNNITIDLAATATALATARAIYGNNFDGTAALTQIIGSVYGGTGNGFTAFTGPATSEKTFTLPNASAVILTDNAAVTIAQGGTGQTGANAAFNALAPAQATHSGKYLTTDGTNTSWATVSGGGSPGGSGSELQYRGGASTFSAVTGSSYNDTTKLLTFAHGAPGANLTASTEASDIVFDGSATRTWATGALTAQREFRFLAPTYAFAGASTLTSAATAYVSGMPIQGTNATITHSHALWIDGIPSASRTQLLKLCDTALASPNSNGTLIAGNCGSGFVGNIIDLQINGSQQMRLSNVGNLTVGGGFLQGSTQLTDGTLTKTNGIMAITNSVAGTTAGYGLRASRANSTTATSGDSGSFQTSATFAPTSGTGTYSGFLANDTFNQTSTATGIARGVYVNPAAVTSVYDLRLFEVAGPTVNVLSGSPSQNASVFNIPTYAAAASKTLATAATVSIAGAPAQGTNVTITNPYALLVSGGASRFDGLVMIRASFTVAGLPSCNSTNQDAVAVITDGLAPTYRGALTGGGSARTLVYCDGSSWTSQ